MANKSRANGLVRKPDLLSKLEGINSTINAAILIPHEDGVISISDDRNVRVWLKRDTGQYWPSICQMMKSEPTAVCFYELQRRLFIGLNNGQIYEFRIQPDYNRMLADKTYTAHSARVQDLIFCEEREWVLSCSRDRYFQWHCAETGQRLGGYQTSAWCTCLQFDEHSQYVFIGDYSGKISILKISNSGSELISVLKGHSGSIRCLAWDAEKSMLYSGSFDQSIIVWDIGGQRGSAFELHGHHDRVQSVLFSRDSIQLISAGDDAIIGFWDMAAQREETTGWAESDTCQKCSCPFFWNIKSMWELKKVGARQHHCRKCGQAICDKCSAKQSVIPKMGYEYDVRVCDSCFEELPTEDKAPLATFHDAKHAVTYADLDMRKKLLLTVGKDYLIKIWDVSSVLH